MGNITTTHDTADSCFFLQLSALDSLHSNQLSESVGEYTFCNHNCTVASSEPVALDESSGHLILVLGQPIWRDSEMQKIALEHGQGAAALKLVESGRTDLEKCATGRFAILLVNLNSSTVIVFNDLLSRIPIYYRFDESHFTCTSSPQILDSSDKLEIAPQGLYNYLYFHMLPSPGSVFAKTFKLQAGATLSWGGGEPDIQFPRVPSFEKSNTFDAREASSQLRQILATAIQHSARQAENPAAFLSGGLDSSTVAGYLSESRGNNVSAYSIGFDADGYDEMAYARITAEHFGIKLNEYYLTPDDIVSALPTLAASAPEPFGNSSVIPTYFCAKLAKNDHVDLLLAGDGGDELFAGNERYAKQKVFEYYKYLPSILRRHLLEPLAKNGKKVFNPLTKVHSYIIQANTPLPDRLQTYNFLHQIDASNVFSAHLLAHVDETYPLALLRDIYLKPKEASNLDRMLFHDWQFTLADNDLRKVGLACKQAGIAVDYPLLYDSVVEFSTTIPDSIKLSPGKLRHFYKEALRGWLPDETLAKSKHGFGLPFGVWMRTHSELRDLTYDSISSLGERNIFLREFLDQAVELHREGHAAYYGELVWLLAVLELWFQAHAPNYKL
jgi:asparagine synthase (glutamine-hydrolysing)